MCQALKLIFGRLYVFVSKGLRPAAALERFRTVECHFFYSLREWDSDLEDNGKKNIRCSRTLLLHR